MKKFFKYLTVLLVLPLLSFTAHDFYTSMTKVEYNSASRTLKFSTKLDIEHLETAIGKKVGDASFDASLSKYFNSHLKVKVNDASQKLNFVAKKPNGQVVWVYLNITNVKEVKSVEVNNTLLFEKYSEQQNFVNFSINGSRESLICKKGKSSGKKTF